MKRLKGKISEFLSHAWDETAYGLRMLCGKPTPMKRFIAVLVVGGALSAANIYFVASGIYNMGVQDAKQELLELQHIEPLELPHKSDSIKSIKNYQLKIKRQDYE